MFGIFSGYILILVLTIIERESIIKRNVENRIIIEVNKICNTLTNLEDIKEVFF